MSTNPFCPALDDPAYPGTPYHQCPRCDPTLYRPDGSLKCVCCMDTGITYENDGWATHEDDCPRGCKVPGMFEIVSTPLRVEPIDPHEVPIMRKLEGK